MILIDQNNQKWLKMFFIINLSKSHDGSDWSYLMLSSYIIMLSWIQMYHNYSKLLQMKFHWNLDDSSKLTISEKHAFNAFGKVVQKWYETSNEVQKWNSY